MIRLRVWANARPMGWFGHAAAEYFFEYDAEWLNQPGAFVLAPQFALAPGRTTGALVRHFFENLLPEGEALNDVMAALQLRGASHFEVLGRLGQELPGVLSLLPPDAWPMHLRPATTTMSLADARTMQPRQPTTRVPHPGCSGEHPQDFSPVARSGKYVVA